VLDLSRLLRRHVPWPGAKCPRPWREKVRVKESSPPEGRHPHPNVLLSGEKGFPSRAIAFGIFQPSKWQSRRSGGGRNPEISGVSQHSLDKATWIPAFPGMTGTSKAKCDNPGLPRHPLMPFIPDLHVPCMYRRVRTIAKLFDSRRRPRRWQDSKVGTVDSRFRGKDRLGQVPLCGKTLQSS
jgi:hypothetical protein